MIRYAALLALRLVVAAVCVLTAAYAVLNCSPFAFDMFIRPQLFPWVSQFATWHHLWWASAYLAGLVTIVADLRRPPAGAPGRRVAAHWLSVGYLLVGGATSAHLVMSPHLPTLWNDARALPTAVVALVPMLWLAIIDHLARPPAQVPGSDAGWSARQQRVLVACLVVAGYLWIAHVARAFVRAEPAGNPLAWVLTSLWTLALCLCALTCLYTCWCLVAALVASGTGERSAGRSAALVLLAGAVCEFLRRAVFPTIALEPVPAAIVAATAGITLATACSGLIRRLPAAGAGPRGAPPASRLAWAGPAVALLVLAVATGYGLDRLERLDWAFAGQKLTVMCEAGLALLVVWLATRRLPDRDWSARALLVPPALALLAVLATPRLALVAAAWTGDRALEPAVAFERFAAAEIAFRFISEGVIDRGGVDADYTRFLRHHASPQAGPVVIPEVDLAAPDGQPGRGPHIFLIAIDSLRRDYLSPYNAAVDFTPHIDAFSQGAFVFRNAFTRHGATQLAAPSLWSGAMVVRNVLAPGFERMNALEKLVVREGYRLAINDHTVAPLLRPTTPVTRIEPDVLSADTDLCSNLDALEAHLESSIEDPRPVFAYMSPMNVHILNTRRGGQESLDGEYPGFYAPYASRVRRMDACFGRFVSSLKRLGLYDRSIIVLTSDHGDSLGEDQYWGHATWIFPEVVRIPLVIHVPTALRSRMTTDLARVAFASDIAPTLYRLLGLGVRDNGPLFGAPLLVPAGEALVDRRRASFLLTSSYGAAYGLLRRNGRLLYITDLVEWREFAYVLPPGAVRARAWPITPDLRRLNQALTRERVSELGSFYRAAGRDAAPTAQARARTPADAADERRPRP